ncbi:MAG: glycosyltransferase family 2 protein [Candidatus Binataceae bacterium]|nr:glycosyltransferase family 2 protein [Candidatus Binataceae bacterium]
MHPEITTVIPTYRRPRLLERAIRSVLGQTYSNFRVCVYDNASDDDTAEVVARIARSDSRVEYHRHLNNIGMMRNFAFGIARVQTPYFNVLGDDDFLLPGFFETAIRMLSADCVPGFFFGGLLFVDESGIVAAPVEGWNLEGSVQRSAIFRALFPGSWITWTSSLFRTAVVAAAGGLKPELGYGGDVELLLRLSVWSTAIVAPQACAVMNLHHGSASAADGGEEYSADRSLAIFRSVEGAIAQARTEGAISSDEAGAMQRIVRDGLNWRFLRHACVMLARGHQASAAATANTLEVEWGRTDLVNIVRLAAGNSAASVLICAALRSLWRVRGAIRRHSNRSHYNSYAAAVDDVLKRLECDDCGLVARYSKRAL